MASQFVFFLVLISLTERVSGHKFKRIDQCGRYIRLKNPYSSGEAFSNIECTEQCIRDKGCLAVTSCAQDGTRWRTCEKHSSLTDLNGCKIYDTNEKCSSWQKLDPCHNGGTFTNNVCVCVPPYSGTGCQNIQPASCSDVALIAQKKMQTVGSSEQFLTTSTQKRVKVFCDFRNQSSGVMYIPKNSLSELTPSELKELVPDRKEFILRQKYNDGTVRETTIKMLPIFQNQPWTITSKTDTSDFDGRIDEKDNPCIFIRGISKNEISKAPDSGFVTDDKEFKQRTDCEIGQKNTNNYFIFYTKKTALLALNNFFCQNWKKLTKGIIKTNLPSEEYFYFGGMNFNCQDYCLLGDLGLKGMAPGFIFR